MCIIMIFHVATQSSSHIHICNHDHHHRTPFLIVVMHLQAVAELARARLLIEVMRERVSAACDV
jgi:hypothetical protein